jgi:hypothetical protein
MDRNKTRLTRPLSKALTTFPAKFACDTLSTSSAPPTLVLARFPFCTIFPFKPSELCPMVMLIYDQAHLPSFVWLARAAFDSSNLVTQVAICVRESPFVSAFLPFALLKVDFPWCAFFNSSMQQRCFSLHRLTASVITPNNQHGAR